MGMAATTDKQARIPAVGTDLDFYTNEPVRSYQLKLRIKAQP